MKKILKILHKDKSMRQISIVNLILSILFTQCLESLGINIMERLEPFGRFKKFNSFSF